MRRREKAREGARRCEPTEEGDEGEERGERLEKVVEAADEHEGADEAEGCGTEGGQVQAGCSSPVEQREGGWGVPHP